jgi:hypothetical protein
MSQPTSDLEAVPTATAVLQRLAPGWAWARHNFTLPALLTIGAVLATSAAWIGSQHADLVELRGRLKGLATAHQVDELHGDLARLLERVDEQSDRLARLEAWQDRVTQVAETPVPRRRH